MTQTTGDRADKLPPGIYPAMLTAFHQNGAIDWDGVDRITDFCIESGVAGIFACGLSAEIDQMDDDEKAALAEHIMRYVDGRVPVVASAITGGSLLKPSARTLSSRSPVPNCVSSRTITVIPSGASCEACIPRRASLRANFYV